MSAATVVAVGAVASAGVAAYGAYNQNQQAKEAQETAQAGNKALYGSKVEPVPYNDRVGTSESYANTVGEEVTNNMMGSLPGVFDVAKQVHQQNMRQREKVSGGQFKSTIRQEGANISAMLEGQVPQDVIESINRMVAENVGGAYDPTSGSMAGNDFARRLGITSLDIMQKGHSFAPAWRNNVDSFVYKAPDAMRDFYTPAAQMTLDASRLQMQRDEAEYLSANNLARAQAMPDPGTVGSFRDSLTLGAIENQSTQNMMNAGIGLVNSGAAAYNSFKQPSVGTTNTRTAYGAGGVTQQVPYRASR